MLLHKSVFSLPLRDGKRINLVWFFDRDRAAPPLVANDAKIYSSRPARKKLGFACIHIDESKAYSETCSCRKFDLLATCKSLDIQHCKSSPATATGRRANSLLSSDPQHKGDPCPVFICIFLLNLSAWSQKFSRSTGRLLVGVIMNRRAHWHLLGFPCSKPRFSTRVLL